MPSQVSSIIANKPLEISSKLLSLLWDEWQGLHSHTSKLWAGWEGEACASSWSCRGSSPPSRAFCPQQNTNLTGDVESCRLGPSEGAAALPEKGHSIITEHAGHWQLSNAQATSLFPNQRRWASDHNSALSCVPKFARAGNGCWDLRVFYRKAESLLKLGLSCPNIEGQLQIPVKQHNLYRNLCC